MHGLARVARDRSVPVEAVTARPPARLKLQFLASTHRRQEVSEPEQAGVNPRRRAVVAVGVGTGYGHATPGLGRFGWMCSARRASTRRAAATPLHDVVVWTVRRCAQGQLGCRSRQAACGPWAPTNTRLALRSSAPLVRETMSEAAVRRRSRIAVAAVDQVPQGAGSVDLTVEGASARASRLW